MAKREGDDVAGLAETHRTLPIALLRAREAVMERFRPVLNAHDITEQQWRVLRVLRENGEVDASKLAERACVLAPSLTRMLKTLEARAYVTVRKDAADARRSLISLTEQGGAFIAMVTPESVAVYAEIEEKLGGEFLYKLIEDLDFLLQALAKK